MFFCLVYKKMNWVTLFCFWSNVVQTIGKFLKSSTQFKPSLFLTSKKEKPAICYLGKNSPI